MAGGPPKPVKVGRVTARVKRGRPPGQTDGRHYWQGYVIEHRKRRTVWTGWGTPDEVIEALSELVLHGIPAARRARREEGEIDEITTVQRLCRAWLAEQQDRRASGEIKPRSLTNYEQAVGRIKDDAIGDVLLGRVDQGTLKRWKARRLEARSPNTFLAEYKVLRMAWRFGQEAGAVDARALPSIQIAAKTVRKKITPEAGEVQRLLRRLDGWVRVALWLQFSTGARIGEVATIRWKDVNLDEREPSIHFEHGKTGPRDVPISRQCASVLRAIAPQPPEAYVTGRTVSTTKKMHRHLRSLCGELGIPEFTSHGIRRLAVELFCDAGVDIRTAADMLGNSPKTIMEHYKQTTPKGARSALRLAQLGYVPEADGEVVNLDDRRKR